MFVTLGLLRAHAARVVGPPTVRVDAGMLEGIRFDADAGGVAFLGVPYAAPPIGDLRWKAPTPPSQWSGTRRAAEFGPSCPQLPAAWLPDLPWKEDCLYLNVWTTNLSERAKQPVIVYLHGGGNRAGRSQHNPLGPALARRGVVVVTVNYRLGALGFLAHPALTAESSHRASGNYGLMDQLYALKWVRDNISRFGGDAAQVTLMGQSAGAYDACLLMTSPLAAGLFHRAVLQSGDCQGTLNRDIRVPLAYNLIAGRTGESAGERLARSLAIAPGTDMLSALRNASADSILEALKKDPGLGFGPVVDGWLLPEQPARTFAEGRQLPVPVLVGSNADEATIFTGLKSVTTVEQYRKILVDDTGPYAEREFEAYPVASDSEVPGKLLQFQSDMLGFGAYSMARATARAGHPAYLYYFTYGGSGKRRQLGAFHGAELLFLSNTFPDDWDRAPDDEAFGEKLRTYWIQFAKTGNPNGAVLPTWPRYDARTDQRFELGRRIEGSRVPETLRTLDAIMKRIVDETTHPNRGTDAGNNRLH